MSINNIGGMYPDNINPNRRRNDDNDNNSNMSNSSSRETASLPASAYRQFIVNTNHNISTSRANDNDAEMQQIYEIDKSIFGDLSSYVSFDDFKRFIARENISVYSVKDSAGKILGYYNLEPLKGDDLYIDSVGLKPQYRNTPKGYAAIQQAWTDILKYAKEKGAQTLSLHVDASDNKQIKLYERLGFQKIETINNYWGAGQNACFMQQQVPEVRPVSSEEPTENSDINFEKSNNNAAEMRAIYEMDSDAFSAQDPYGSYEEFIEYITERDMSVYSVKDKDGNMLGYYSFEPVTDGNLYIDSIVLKPEYRNTKTGYKAINESWAKILDEAKEKGAQKLSLHVDGENPKLKKLYERFGFQVKEQINNYYENGHSALYMEMIIPQEDSPSVDVAQVDVPQESDVSETNQTSKEILLKQNYTKKVAQVKEELKNRGISSVYYVKDIIESSSYYDPQTGEKVFSDELYSAVNELLDLGYADSTYYIDQVMRFLTYKDDERIKHVQDEVIPILKDIKNAGIEKHRFIDLLKVACVRDSKDRLMISPDILRKAIDIKSWGIVKDYNISEVMKIACLKDKDGTVHFSDKILSKYKSMSESGSDDINHIINASLEYDAQGKQYFDEELCTKLFTRLKNSNYNDPIGLFYGSKLDQIYMRKMSTGDYLKHAEYVRRDPVIKEALSKYNKNEDIGEKESVFCDVGIINTSAVINAILYDAYVKDYTDYSTNENYKIIEKTVDQGAFDAIKSTLQQTPMPFDNLKNLAEIVDVCRERTSGYSAYKFNSEIFEKALQLKTMGLSDKNIIEIIDACKLKDSSNVYSSYTKPIIKFNNDMFNKFIEYQNTATNKWHYNANTLKCCVECIDGKEKFNSEVFDLVAKNDCYNAMYFVKTSDDGKTKIFDIDTYKTYIEKDIHDIKAVSEISERKCLETIYIPSKDMIEAYAELKSRNIQYYKEAGDVGTVEQIFLRSCVDVINYNDKFRPEVFQNMISLLDAGYSGKQVKQFINACFEHKHNSKTGFLDRVYCPERFEFARKMMDEEGLNIELAAYIAALKKGTNIENGVMTNIYVDKIIDLYNLNMKNSQYYFDKCFDKINEEDVFNPVAYERLKETVERGFSPDIIDLCKDGGVFKDRIFKMAIDMQNKGYTPADIASLLKLCHVDNPNSKVKENELFSQEMFNHISELEELGIKKELILKYLKACKYDSERFFDEKVFEKIYDLKNKGYDEKGIITFLSTVVNTCRGDAEKTEYMYNRLLLELAKRKQLKTTTQDDSYVIGKIYSVINQIQPVRDKFGDDVLDYAISYKTDNYVNFITQSNKLIKNLSETTLNNLQSKLSELISPELKAKRIRVIAGLAGKIDENGINILINRMKSPKMTEDQAQIINDIFTPAYIDEEVVANLTKNQKEEMILQEYEKRVNRCLEELKVPKQFKKTVYAALMKERLDKAVVRPKSIEEQLAQMEKNSQQILANPKIPENKKAAYIEEYNAKKADMEQNPEKYMKPYISSKPMANISKVVEAYINIPNDDVIFNSTVTLEMYNKLGIEPSTELLESINYDLKYFDRLLAAPDDFKDNFRKLIELRKMTADMPLTQARIKMPEAGSENYYKYQNLGLIEQIKANLDTVKQFEENQLDFDKWNSFDPNLNGEVFTVKADPKTEYENLQYSLAKIFNDELWNQIKEDERENLMECLKYNNFSISDNKILKDGQSVKNTELESFINIVEDYISKNTYWDGSDESQYTEAYESESVAGFKDHLKNLKEHLNEIKGARTVTDIHFRLSDENDIGRNIFFGNHVGCCNSVESTFAGYSAPMHLLNNYNRGLELVDDFGNSYGNSLCFFANIDGQLCFVIDSFEAKGELASNPIVSENLIKFAKQVCREMGREDAKVMIGPNFNNMDKSKLITTPNHTIKVLGTVSAKTYCDSVGGKVTNEINIPVKDRKMLEPIDDSV